jgi:integrase/recombinase XerD
MKISLESQEVNLLAQSVTHLPDRLLISIFVHTGSRISEAHGLTGYDIHFDSSNLTIQHLKARVTITCPGYRARLSRSSVYYPGCSFHSFVVYFSGLRRKDWVEATGIGEPFEFQDCYPP